MNYSLYAELSRIQNSNFDQAFCAVMQDKFKLSPGGKVKNDNGFISEIEKNTPLDPDAIITFETYNRISYNSPNKIGEFQLGNPNLDSQFSIRMLDEDGGYYEVYTDVFNSDVVIDYYDKEAVEFLKEQMKSFDFKYGSLETFFREHGIVPDERIVRKDLLIENEFMSSIAEGPEYLARIIESENNKKGHSK